MMSTAFYSKPMATPLHLLLRDMRKRACLSQVELAAVLGMAQPTISQIEKGVRDTSLHVAEQWAKACGADLGIAGVTPEQDPLVEQLASAMPKITADERRLLRVLIEELTRACSAR